MSEKHPKKLGDRENLAIFTVYAVDRKAYKPGVVVIQKLRILRAVCFKNWLTRVHEL